MGAEGGGSGDGGGQQPLPQDGSLSRLGMQQPQGQASNLTEDDEDEVVEQDPTGAWWLLLGARL